MYPYHEAQRKYSISENLYLWFSQIYTNISTITIYNIIIKKIFVYLCSKSQQSYFPNKIDEVCSRSKH